jgi:DNA-binding CsgD family transcriptional regulator
MALGLTSMEVADRVNVPVHLVRGHMRAAMLKLGACSKLEALIIAIRHELIRHPGS